MGKPVSRFSITIPPLSFSIACLALHVATQALRRMLPMVIHKVDHRRSSQPLEVAERHPNGILVRPRFEFNELV
jgi:hypothetical protein